VGRGRGRGPGGPEAHREPAGDVGLAGDGPAAANLVAEQLGFRRGNGDGVGYSGHLGSIALAGRQRKATGIFSAPQRSKGWRLMAALGGELRLL
jgi:hypothetical protein